MFFFVLHEHKLDLLSFPNTLLLVRIKCIHLHPLSRVQTQVWKIPGFNGKTVHGVSQLRESEQFGQPHVGVDSLWLN